ncbi:hypothetical protein C8Q76DRAFT_698650 [Earliella scabrosa]|nr:hypothetical protein C8Q76DRAFT_698650 [Earliella scabrosa]
MTLRLDLLIATSGVCRLWRWLTHSTPLLWTHLTQEWHLERQIVSRSAELPLMLSIPSRSTFSSRVKDAYVSLCDRVKEVHINDFSGAESTFDPTEELLKMLQTTPFPQLERCKIELDVWADRLGGPMETGHTLRWAWREIDIVVLVRRPIHTHESLTQFVVHNTAHLPVEDLWSLHDLLMFLTHTPKLEELSVVDTGSSALRHPVEAGWRSTVELRALRWFTIGDEHDNMVAISEVLLGAIATPVGCHIHFLSDIYPFRQDPTVLNPAQLISLRPGFADATKMRLWLPSPARCITQLASPSSHGSMTLSWSSDRVGNVVSWTKSQSMYMIIPPVSVQELWIRLHEEDYRPGRRQPLPLRSFPNLKRLVIGQPAHMHDPRSFEEIGSLLDPLTGFLGLDGEASSAMACPLLDTLCINLPPYMRHVRPLTALLVSRAQTHPIRRVIIGYDSALEPDVLAEVYGLEAFVGELVCAKLDTASYSASATDAWLMDIPVAFDGKEPFHACWPSWP